eukprot:gnl/MRDRNA2_/MRDRNA2_88724_c0_seq1.p1 gnl/MRDRNA2_/MRDRNA2_88724_c0~~gnl/MRDRNA2_/MRDRNA2_88724_c0_seq1.p1  ORF type:complete len:218 (+),score=73.67 gnl/MRDRNA2_/MRDRNA2_88724_c0_seq1:103-756(+)
MVLSLSGERVLPPKRHQTGVVLTGFKTKDAKQKKDKKGKDKKVKKKKDKAESSSSDESLSSSSEESPSDSSESSGKKKKKKKRQDVSDDEEEETEDEEEEEPESQAIKLPPNKYAQMNIESVKGKVSKANENMTDKDLERRFGSQISSAASGSGLMTEEQALALLMKDKGKRRPESAAARVQREMEEWEDTKKWREKRKRSRSGGRMITNRRGPPRY